MHMELTKVYNDAFLENVLHNDGSISWSLILSYAVLIGNKTRRLIGDLLVIALCTTHSIFTRWLIVRTHLAIITSNGRLCNTDSNKTTQYRTNSSQL